MREELIVVTATTPRLPGTLIGPEISGLARFDWLTLFADLVGAVGGTLDIHLQSKLGPDLWGDFIRLPQLLAGAAVVRYAAPFCLASTRLPTQFIRRVSFGTDESAAPSMVFAAPSGAPPAGYLPSHPGDVIRPVYVAGAGTTAGAAVKLYFACRIADQLSLVANQWSAALSP